MMEDVIHKTNIKQHAAEEGGNRKWTCHGFRSLTAMLM